MAFPYLTHREILLKTGIAQKENFYIIKVFTLEDNKTLRFDIPNFSDYVKFIFTPNISLNNQNIENISNLYSTVKYSIYNDNKLLETKIFTFKSNYIRYIDSNATIVKPILYDDSNLTPTSSTSLKLNLNRFKKVTNINFETVSKDKNIVDISMRGYFIERNSKSKVKKIWGHLPLSKKIILFKDNVYPLYYISQAEKSIRLQALWKPNAPVGILGKSYHLRNMLKRKNMQGISPVVYVQPVIYSDSNITATRYLNSGNYKIYIKDAQKRVGDIELSLYNTHDIISDNNYSLSFVKTHPIDLNLSQPVIVAISSNTPISYMIEDSNKKQNLYLPAQTSSYYQIDSNQSINYQLLQTSNRVIKIECRSSSLKKSILKIALKDKNGKILKVLEQNLSFEASKYDYLDNFHIVSKPVYYILPLSDDISTINLSASSSILAKIYSRNFEIPYPLYTNKSYSDTSYTTLPKWFTLRPQQFSLSSIKRIREYIYKQIKPPVISTYTQQGLYSYQPIYPIDNIWHGYSILQSRLKDTAYIRQKSWSSIYAQIKNDDNITLHSEVNASPISAKVIIIQKTKKDANISVSLDNIKIIDTKINSRVNIFDIDDISTIKKYRVSISTEPKDSDIKVFISNTALKNRTFIQKSFILFDKALHFEVEKSSDMNESIKIEFAIKKSNESGSLYKSSIDIDGNLYKTTKLYNRFTFDKYLAFFTGSKTKAYILNDKAKELNCSKPVYIPLGDNLRESNYSLTLYPYRYNKDIYINITHIGLGEEDISIRREY